MGNKTDKPSKEDEKRFNDVLKVLLNTPPLHKITKKKSKKMKVKSK